MNANDRNWSQKWEHAKYYLNNLPKATLDGLTSNEALYGRPFHVPYKIGTSNDGAKEPFIKALNGYIKQLHPAIQAFQVQRYQKLLRKDNNNCPVLELGTQVLVWKPNLFNGKLGTNWSGPFYVHRRISKDSYILKCPLTKREYRLHISLIRPLKNKIGDSTKFVSITDEIDHSSRSDEKPRCVFNEIKEDTQINDSRSTAPKKDAEPKEDPKNIIHDPTAPLKNDPANWSKRLRPRK